MNRRLMVGTFVVLLVTSGSLAAEENPNDIVQIEESWELVVRDPDPNSVAPQVTNAFAPVRQGDVLYATVNLNHHLNGDDFRAGGIQLQLWHGDLLLAKRTSDKNGILAKPGEVIKWTQVVSVDDGVVRFSVRDGSSETWGSFGGPLSIGILTNLESLNDYRSSDSIGHSGVTFAANRVTSLKLTKVCATFRSGETQTVTPTSN